MSKTLTKQDQIKKLQTNVKSAQSIFALSGILTLIYMVRYFITGNFNFYFSAYITEFALKAADESIASTITLSSGVAYAIVGAFVLLFVGCCALAMKPKAGLWACLIFYLLDFAALISGTALSVLGPFREEVLIDIIIHVFVVLFLIVGVRSAKKLPELEKEAE